MSVSASLFKALDLAKPIHLKKPRLPISAQENQIKDQVILTSKENRPPLNLSEENRRTLFSYSYDSDDINQNPLGEKGKKLSGLLDRLINARHSSPGKTIRAEREDRASSVAFDIKDAERNNEAWDPKKFYSTSTIDKHTDLCDVMSKASSEGKYHSSGYRATLPVVFGDSPIDIQQISSNRDEKERLYNFGTSKFKPLITGRDKTGAFHAALEQTGRPESSGKLGYTEALLDPEVKIS
jgi:hypothetical protein